MEQFTIKVTTGFEILFKQVLVNMVSPPLVMITGHLDLNPRLWILIS